MLRTPWSEPSNVVFVPEDVRVLARNVPVPHPGGEPEANVMIMKWIQDSGVTAHEEFSKLMRGTLLDFPHRRFRAVPTSPRDRGMGDLERMSRDRRPSHPAPAAPRDYVPVDYITGATLVDIASDGPAGRILLVDEAGNLTAHNDDRGQGGVCAVGRSSKGRRTIRAWGREGPGNRPQAARRTRHLRKRRQTARQRQETVGSRVAQSLGQLRGARRKKGAACEANVAYRCVSERPASRR